MKAYVLIQTDDSRGVIADDLRRVPGTVFAQDLRGPYDAIALVDHTSSTSSIGQVLAGMRCLPGVTRVISAPLVSSLGTTNQAA